MTACTFNGSTVPSYKVEEMHAKGALTFDCTIQCRTGTYSDITTLQALQGHIGVNILASGKTRIQTTGGTKGSLVLNGTTYPNCYIEDLSDIHEVPKSTPFARWEFVIKFVQETV